MTAYYNEIHPPAVFVLRSLIEEGLIAPGHVDDRSIKDVQPDDLQGFTQVHLFAGAGLWSVAARLAGWPDDRPIWSASCPCQPFSTAGKGLGVDDARHLWPDVDRLLHGARERGFGTPAIVGEQVAGSAGANWFDRVRADLEERRYRARVVDITACAVDSPQVRQRLYWCAVEDVADSDGRGRVEDRIGCGVGEVPPGRAHTERSVSKRGSGGRNGSDWAGWEWLVCPDGFRRRTEPRIRLLDHGLAGRAEAGRLAGNGIVVPLAAEVIASLMEFLDIDRPSHALAGHPQEA